MKDLIKRGMTPGRLVQPVLDGEVNPLSALEDIQHLSKLLEDAKKMIQDMAMEEASRYGKGEPIPSRLGYVITKKSGRRIFTYNDLSIKTQEQRLKEMKECAKKGIPTEDGEVFEKPIETYTKDILSFTKIR